MSASFFGGGSLRPQELKLWTDALAECDTPELFNRLAVATARDRRKLNPRDQFVAFVAAEAKRRKYTWIGGKDDGWYVDVTPAEREVVMEHLRKIEKREDSGKKTQDAKMRKLLRKTRIEFVSAAWEEWVYGGALDNHGPLLIMDYRKRVNNQMRYEFDRVPRELYQRLFGKDAKTTLTNIFRMFQPVAEPEVREWLQIG